MQRHLTHTYTQHAPRFCRNPHQGSLAALPTLAAPEGLPLPTPWPSRVLGR